jgi:hypothetical protein
MIILTLTRTRFRPRVHGEAGPGVQPPPSLIPIPHPSAEVTSETFNKEAFLASRGLTRGYWTQLSMLIPGSGTPRHPRGSTPSLNLLLDGTWVLLSVRNGPQAGPSA